MRPEHPGGDLVLDLLDDLQIDGNPAGRVYAQVQDAETPIRSRMHRREMRSPHTSVVEHGPELMPGDGAPPFPDNSGISLYRNH